MGLFNFVKEAGEKLWDNLTDHKGQSDKITEHLKKLNIPGSDKVQVNVTDGKAKKKSRSPSATSRASARWRTISPRQTPKMKQPTIR